MENFAAARDACFYSANCWRGNRRQLALNGDSISVSEVAKPGHDRRVWQTAWTCTWTFGRRQRPHHPPAQETDAWQKTSNHG